MILGLEPTFNSLLKSKLGIKPTNQVLAYTTRIRIANEKTIFFAIFGAGVPLKKLPAIVGIVPQSGNNARPKRFVAPWQAACL